MAAVDYVLGAVSDDDVARVEALAELLASQLRAVADGLGLPLLVSQVGPVVFTSISSADRVRDYRDVVDLTDFERWASLRLELLVEGVRLLERGLWYLSTAHDEDDISRTVAKAERAFRRSAELDVCHEDP
jgi:glutamate-1-semialdehyde 2,1-aminomutase